ncbi:MAG: hypothetical protein H7246_09555 [Phycisphaerae bacterium]|nr:hypothetical protein [Saprospiraceae bacterium]
MKWIKNQDIVAYYLYRCRNSKSKAELEKIGEQMGIDLRALQMRIANFKFLSGQGGLNKPAKMSKATFEEHHRKDIDEFENIVSKILSER